MSNRLEPHSSTLVNLVEKYVSTKRDGKPIDQNHFVTELKKLGKSPEQIHDLIIEMDDDADKELLAGEGLKTSNRIFAFGLILGVSGIAFSIAQAMGILGSGRLTIIPLGLIGAAFVAVGKSYAEIGLVEKRRKRRALKYEKWN